MAQKIREFGAEFLLKEHISCSKSCSFPSGLPRHFSRFCDLEKVPRFGIVSFDFRALNGRREEKISDLGFRIADFLSLLPARLE